MTTPNAPRLALVSLVAGLLAGCAGVLQSDKPPRQVYLLQPPSAPAAAAATAVDTLVLSVSAVPGLDTNRILVLGRDARLNPVANAHWADHLPEIFRSVTRRALADSGRFGRVTVGSIARPDEWLVDLELQSFFGIEGAGGATEAVHLRLEAGVRCGDTRERLVLEAKTPASAASIASLVDAYQKALDDALRRLPGRITDACAG